ncbi:AraC family transcriptional regulator [Aquimarina sp. AD10]|uniref:AraC family transcriptional regulator n=1 Tax=Aquimarina sp. AD10 TaxID=1714849 RepID=UPI000E550E1B|nr:helix-turn-helix domain-containing protein [Aquimarina sp. AD10]AXT59596.1 AraC family transcriptional regulator [Aquimarina sp. AD10]RKM94723.1 helix-turn-helix domain-containing protein [Aquimarina sp. AD10]
MSFLDILLIIISSAGLLHGVLFALYLMIFKNKKSLTNFLLGWILVFMAFRIGKSVMLNFGDDLEPIFIFLGLTFLLIIGPFLKFYIFGMTRSNFKLPRHYILELVPFILIFIASLFVTRDWYENSKFVIVIFSSGLIFIYLHLAFYIGIAWRVLHQTKKQYSKKSQTKSQKAILKWLQLLLIGFVFIWISYVINILDETIPYIVGPIVYSLVIYFLSYKALVLKSTDLDGDVFKTNDDEFIFTEILKHVEKEKLYLESDISLVKLSKIIRKSPQLTSLIINQYANRNFNDFINFYRIQEAKVLLSKAENNAYTISSIAFDTGFSSLSSFNSAFKKFEGLTPSSFRKNKI